MPDRRLNVLYRAVLAVCLAALRSDASPTAPPARTAVDPEPLPADAFARVGSSRLRHREWITSVAFSPDGKWIASIGGEGLATVWEAASGRRHFHVLLNRGAAQLLRMAFTPDSKEVVLLDSTSCRIVDVQTGVERTVHPHPQGDTAILACLAPDGSLFATAQRGKGISVRDTRTGKERYSLPGNVTWGSSITFSADGKGLAVNGSGDSRGGEPELHVFDAATGKRRARVNDGKRSFSAAALAPDGKTLAALSSSTTGEEVILWDVGSGKVARRIRGQDWKASCLAFSPDGKLLALGSYAHLWLQLFDASTGKEVRRLRCWPNVTTVAFSADGKTLAAGKGEGNITLWDVATGKVLPASSDPDGSVVQMRFSDDGRNLLTVAGDITLRDWRRGRIVRRYPDPRTEPGLGFSVSPDGQTLSVCDGDGKVRLVDARTGKEGKVLKGHQAPADRALFAPDGRRLFTMGNDNSVRIWDVATGEQLHRLAITRFNTEGGLAVSPDGKVLAGLCVPAPNAPSVIHLWDSARGTELRRLQVRDAGGRVLAFSPDGSQIIGVGQDPETGPLGVLQLWDVASGRRLRWFAAPSGPFYGAAFSPDGRMLATGGHDRTVRLWEVASGKERRHFSGHASPVLLLTFSPDGRFLTSTSAEAPVYVWDVIGTAGWHPAPLSRTEKARAWQDLADPDAAAAFGVMRRLAASPDDAIALLGEHLSPTPAAEVERARRLLADLDADDFEVRQRATEELAKVAEQVEVLLRQARKGASVETSRRLDGILHKIDKPSSERLRQARAVEVLQWLATPAADRLLARLAGGAAGAWLTTEAATARERLRHRTP